MALAAGVRTVTYTIGLSGSNVPQVDVEFTAVIRGDNPTAKQACDDAVALGAQAIIDALTVEYPQADVVGSRQYDSTVVDSGWPTP